MTAAIEITESGNLLEVQVTGKLTREFYQDLAPRVDALIRQHGRIRVLLVMHDFHGWTLGAMWEDMKFDLAHWKDIERLALVGESKWEQGMATFCKPFTKASIQYFDHSKLEDARRWITA
ncbi:MAG: STAS/SEC14 domain-containing protein [Verrucomicrobia bacterium]|nr:STAS/SEC14 domain-containing protein [Verrucomicrobiota bacterium]